MLQKETPAITINSLADLPQAAARFDTLIDGARIVCFWGGMGSGKTTFIKALCEHWGVTDKVTSPTFSLINEYLTRDGTPIYHFDFFRIETLEEAWDIGCQEYFSRAEGRCLIEWPLLVEELLPEKRLDVSIRSDAQGRRRIEFNSKKE